MKQFYIQTVNVFKEIMLSTYTELKVWLKKLKNKSS